MPTPNNVLNATTFIINFNFHIIFGYFARSQPPYYENL